MVVVVVSLAHDEVAIDRVALRVDDLDVFEQPVERLGLAHLGDEVGDGVVLLVGLAHLVGLLADLQRDAGVLGVEVVVGDLEALGRADGAQGEVDLDRLLRLHLQSLDERGRVLPGDLQPLIDRDALRLELLHRVLHPTLQVGLHHRLGRLDVDEPGQRRRGALDELVAGLVELAGADALGERGAPLLDRFELAEVLADPFVGQLGQLGLLHLGDVDGEVGRLVGAVRRGGEGQLVALARAEQLAVETRGDPAAADLVQPVLGVQPGNRLAVAAGGEREGDLVAGLDRAIDVDQRALPAQLGFDRLVDVGLRWPSGDGSSTRRPP